MKKESAGGKIMNWKGKLIDPFNLEPDDLRGIGLQLAVTLSRIQRFWGQLRESYTVAQHCLSMVEYFDGDPGLQRWAISHEVFEGLGIGDIPKPIKSRLPEIEEAEERALKLFASIYGLPWPMPAEIKEADRGILVMEALNLLPYNPEYNWEEEYGKPLGRLYRLGAKEAEIKEDFLRKWQELFGSI